MISKKTMQMQSSLNSLKLTWCKHIGTRQGVAKKNKKKNQEEIFVKGQIQ